MADTLSRNLPLLLSVRSDTDLVITTASSFDDETRKRSLFQLASLMRSAHITPYVQVIHRARVPVISFQTVPDLGESNLPPSPLAPALLPILTRPLHPTSRHPHAHVHTDTASARVPAPGALKVDISLNATDGIRAVPILRGFFERMPALRFLVLALKALLTRHALNTASSSGLGSYGLVCLAISFLQRNPRGRPQADIDAPMERAALGGLLVDFLGYYGHEFDYETSVVSVKEGKLLLKEDKGWVNAHNPYSLSIECMMNPGGCKTLLARTLPLTDLLW